MLFQGLPYKRQIQIPCPSTFTTDQQTDEYLAKFIERAPMPPGLIHGAPIMGRNQKLQRVICITFYGPNYTITNNNQRHSTQILYNAYIRHLLNIINPKQPRQTT